MKAIRPLLDQPLDVGLGLVHVTAVVRQLEAVVPERDSLLADIQEQLALAAAASDRLRHDGAATGARQHDAAILIHRHGAAGPVGAVPRTQDLVHDQGAGRPHRTGD